VVDVRAAESKEKWSYLSGILISLVAHLLGAVVAIAVFEHRAATAYQIPEVFTVTLEGGEKLGGITQVPDEGVKSEAPPLDAVPADEPGEEESTKSEATEAKLEKPAVVEDPERILAEKKAAEQKLKEAERKKQEEEKKKKEEAKKQEEAKKKAEDEKRKKAEEEAKRIQDKKRQEEADKKRQAAERAARDNRLSELSRRYRAKYAGESANAGGEGFGAASLGGQGMGGGTLADAEYIRYAQALKEHVKAGWHWLPGSSHFRARVRVRILPSGMIQDVRIEQSSGNSNFDDSVVRAVTKASPVPTPPEKYYSDFKDVRFWFDSHEPK
jgi:colicin import membrane protein